jgi:hypothetical protein
VGKAEGRRSQGRYRRKWVGNIKMDLAQTGVGGVGWIGLAQDGYKWRVLVNEAMKLLFHKILGRYRMASQLVASRVVLTYIEVASQLVS